MDLLLCWGLRIDILGLMNLTDEKYSRLLPIYGDDKVKRFFESKVAVLGLGGVGSYCASALARAGVGSLVLVDFDKVEQSNINRQLFAVESSVGRAKVEVAAEYIKDINPDIELDCVCEKIAETNISEICADVDYIVDAIDDVPAKIAIAKFSQDCCVSLISCMGTAQRLDATQFKFANIYDTSVCPLCKTVRKLAREKDIKKLEVLYSTEPAVKAPADSPYSGMLGSTSYVPPIAGMMLAGKVLCEL